MEGCFILFAVLFHSSASQIKVGPVRIEFQQSIDLLHGFARTVVTVVQQGQSCACLHMVGLQADEMLVVGSCLLIESLMGVDISAEEECLGMVSV